MLIRIVTISILVSDQYGTTRDVLIGAFDISRSMERLTEMIEGQYGKKGYNYTIHVKEVELNQYNLKGM